MAPIMVTRITVLFGFALVAACTSGRRGPTPTAPIRTDAGAPPEQRPKTQPASSRDPRVTGAAPAAVVNELAAQAAPRRAPATTTTSKTADTQLANAVRERLRWAWLVDAEQVHVEARAGTVILSGTVDTYAERRGAAESALEAGAVLVDNRLRVGEKTVSPDQ